jgi:hypothetical protein
MTPTPFALSIAALLLASALSSIGWILEGEAIARLDPLSVVCCSLILGGVALLGIAHLRGGNLKLAFKEAIDIRFVLFSIFRCALVSLLFGYCLTLTSSTKTMFLTKIEPYIVLLIQIIWLGHRTTLQHLTLLGIHIGGAVLLSTGGRITLSQDILGDLLILIAVTGHAATYHPARRFADKLGSLYASGFSQLIGGLALLPFMLATTNNLLLLTPERLTGWCYALATVLVFYILSSSLWFYSLKGIPSWLASALRSFGPLIAAPIAWLVFDQRLTNIQVFGALTVVLTSALMVLLERRERGG